MSSTERVSCGIDLATCVDMGSTIQNASQNRYDFVCIPLMHPRYKRETLDCKISKRPGPLSRSDTTLSCHDWSSLVVGKTSPWIQLDSDLLPVRKNSEQAFARELDWAAHLGIPAILIPMNSGKCYNLARAIYEHTFSLANTQYWMRIPVTAPSIDVYDEKDEDKCQKQDTWQWWDALRTLTNRQKRIGVCLELTSDLPSQDEMNRWYGEPIKSVILPTDIFLTNKKGYPVLSQAHQNVVCRLFQLNAQVIVTGASLHEKGHLVYQQYLDHLYRIQEPPDSVSLFARGYEDHLQCPLQPLMDNLESQTYETFEKDPVKYAKYQEAVYNALIDRVPEDVKATQVSIIMVVGAGRGPLVTASLSAAKKADRKVRVYAVDKNPNAVITLENLQQDEWGEQVTVVSCDMRDWNAPEKADILVSELLGSFGDNELSPECLDGAQKYLKEDGISIPSSYTSWIAPLQYPKIHTEVHASREKDKHPDAPFEMPYVVRLHNCQVLSKPQEVFTFTHPNRDTIDNERYTSLTFNIHFPNVMHGFAGYFETVLYKDVTFSILPETHTPGMFSWFPIFLPIKTPVHVNAGDRVTLHLWRRVTCRNVWYEWSLSEPYPVPIHNPKGRSYTIGL